MINGVGFQKLRQHSRGKIGLPLIQITGRKFNWQQTAPFQLVQQREQRIAVFAAQRADQPARTRLDHLIEFDLLAGLAHKPLAQFLKFG